MDHCDTWPSYGITFETGAGMMISTPRAATSQSPQRLLAWTFRRGAQLLTCELRGTSDRHYAVIVTPHWSSGTTRVEEQANGVAAFHRHAALALQLRQQ